MNSFKVSVMVAISSLVFFLIYVTKHITEWSNALWIMSISIVLAILFRRWGNSVLDQLRPYEVALLTSTDPPLISFIAKILKELVFIYNLSMKIELKPTERSKIMNMNQISNQDVNLMIDILGGEAYNVSQDQKEALEERLRDINLDVNPYKGKSEDDFESDEAGKFTTEIPDGYDVIETTDDSVTLGVHQRMVGYDAPDFITYEGRKFKRGMNKCVPDRFLTDYCSVRIYELSSE